MSTRQTQLQQKADDWIERNPDGYSILVHRCLAKTQTQDKFSIRQLCESLRWEGQHGLLKGTDEFAIPNEITRYIGLRIMDSHPRTAEYMTTRKTKKPTMLYPQVSPQVGDNQRGAAVAVAAWTKDVLSSSPQALVWRVDLEQSFGAAETDHNPDVHSDGRFTKVIDRLISRLKISKGETELRMMVRCRSSFRAIAPGREYIRVEYPGNQRITLSEWVQRNPPIGEWLIEPANSGLSSRAAALPVSYFTDGIPF